MRKYISIGVVLFLSLTPLATFATSGACSYHSGVNCSAGASITGNAICNDGSISSVSFYSMDECRVNTVSDFCSSLFPTQELSSYMGASSDAVRQLIKSEVTSDIQVENQVLNFYQQKLNSLIQSDTSMWSGTIQQAQSDQQSAISTAQAQMAALNSSGGISSANEMYISQAGNEYNATIQSDQNYENMAIQSAHAQFDPSINSANQCLNSLNQLSKSLNTYQVPVIAAPQQTNTNIPISPVTSAPQPAAQPIEYGCASNQTRVNKPNGSWTCTISIPSTPIQSMVQPTVRSQIAEKKPVKKNETVATTSASTTTVLTTISSLNHSRSTTSPSVSNKPVEKTWYGRIFDYLSNIF